jgi:hypothetical protein
MPVGICSSVQDKKTPEQPAELTVGEAQFLLQLRRANGEVDPVESGRRGHQSFRGLVVAGGIGPPV